MEKRVCKIALLGLGTVGTGVVHTLEKQANQLYLRTGIELEICCILVRDLKKERGFPTAHLPLTDSVEVLAIDPTIQIVVEVMGGIEPAKTLIEDSLMRGRHVITANKELMAKHGKQLQELAKQNGVEILYEASVAGGIPIIHTLKEYLKINQVHSISGILNGTSNYILTQMSKYGREYTEALEEAQRIGYAEANPASDVEGYDAVYKLAILCSLAFGIHVPVESIERIGIQSITSRDIRLAREMGFVIKHIGEAEYDGYTVALQVSPQLLPFDHSLAGVDDVFNAISIQTDVVGELTFIGRGAGQFPTASAVIEDILTIVTAKPKVMDTRASVHRVKNIEKINPVVSTYCTEFYLRFSSHSLDSLERIRLQLKQSLLHTNGEILAYQREQHDGIYTHAYRVTGLKQNAWRKWLQHIADDIEFSLNFNILPIFSTKEISGSELLSIGTRCSQNVNY